MPINVHSRTVGCSSVFVLLLTIGTGTAWAGDPVNDCDTLAASTLDATRPASVAGKEFEAINGDAALAACIQAYEASNHDPRMAYQLSRALLKSANEANTKAEALLLEASKAGHTLSMANLGQLLEPNDRQQAMDWFTKGAELGDAVAMFRLGNRLKESDPKKSFEWYAKSAALGYVLAQYNVGVAYQDGIGTEVDIPKAIEFYNKAMDQGDKISPHNLAVLYDDGKMVPRDMAKAIPLYELAADRGYSDAMLNLALAMQKGDGVPADPARALALFEKAASLGDKEAAKVVDMLKAQKQ